MINERKYELLSDIEHVLLRPSRYIGSTKTETKKMYLFRDDKIQEQEVEFNFGFNKLFDEILSNSIDESKKNIKLNEIKISISTQKNQIRIFDNGGISTQIHKETGLRVPELIFGNLKSGSNFNDEDVRTGSGTHGEGSTLVNIFSSFFSVNTADGENLYYQEWHDSMSNKTDGVLSKSKKKFTEITYIPKLEIFQLKDLSSQLEFIKFRVLEVSICNPNIKIELYIDEEKHKIPCSSINEFSKLINPVFYSYKANGIELSLSLSDDGFQQISFANFVRTYEGGTHLNSIVSNILTPLTEHLIKKLKIKTLKQSDVKSKLFIVLRADIKNTTWTSQAKEKLDVSKDNLLFNFSLTPKELKKLCDSIQIENEISDWFKQKTEVDERKILRQVNSNTKNAFIPGLIDAEGVKVKNIIDRSKCRLLIFEGKSAISAVRKLRQIEYVGAYPLRGKFINVEQATIKETFDNTQAVNLAAAMGLEFFKEINFKKLRYSQIEICTDADVDGISIASQLLVYFAKFFPELLSEGRIFKSETPLYVVYNKKDKLYFYTQADFDSFMIKNINNKNIIISQKKGLASLEDVEYEMMLNNPKLTLLTMDDLHKKTIQDWFGEDTQERKRKLLEL